MGGCCVSTGHYCPLYGAQPLQQGRETGKTHNQVNIKSFWHKKCCTLKTGAYIFPRYWRRRHHQQLTGAQLSQKTALDTMGLNLGWISTHLTLIHLCHMDCHLLMAMDKQANLTQCRMVRVEYMELWITPMRTMKRSINRRIIALLQLLMITMNCLLPQYPLWCLCADEYYYPICSYIPQLVNNSLW